MKARITNTARVQQTFNLSIEYAPVRKVFERVDNKTARVVFADSVTFLAGETQEHPAGILSCPDIASAVKAKRLRVEMIEPVAASKGATETVDTSASVDDSAKNELPRSRVRKT
jgi:hypothetical protein